MTEPYLGEIRIVGFNFPPRGYAQCDGQLLPIDQNQALFSILGTFYGGDGRTTFALPDMRGRTPVHVGGGFTLGQKTGEETHVLTAQEVPGHDHDLHASSTDANSLDPTSNILARRTAEVYRQATNLGSMNTGTISSTGGVGHDNMQPFLALNFIIALQGTFPPRN